MSSRYYPLYQKGNPQLRIFLPNFWMKLIRPKEPLPPNVVLFQTSIEMTKHDVKNYLEKIYKIPVVEVKTTIKMGEIKRKYGDTPRLIKEDDYKEALVIMPKDQVFEFPNVTKDVNAAKEMERYKQVKEMYTKSIESTRSKYQKGIPTWFAK